MWERGLICLAIVVSVCLAGIAFLPAGTGPYTAVYGPATALRAQRAVLLLSLAISFVSTVFLVLAAFGSSLLGIPGSFISAGDDLPLASLSAGLRC